jgi:hypothetical protein
MKKHVAHIGHDPIWITMADTQEACIRRLLVSYLKFKPEAIATLETNEIVAKLERINQNRPHGPFWIGYVEVKKPVKEPERKIVGWRVGSHEFDTEIEGMRFSIASNVPSNKWMSDETVKLVYRDMVTSMTFVNMPQQVEPVYEEPVGSLSPTKSTYVTRESAERAINYAYTFRNHVSGGDPDKHATAKEAAAMLEDKPKERVKAGRE